MAIVADVQQPPWDPVKERANRARHGIGFDEGLEAITDPLFRERPDPDHSIVEDRSIIIGESTVGRLLVVVVTFDTEGKMRIISARRATKRERHAYEDD